MDNVFSKINIEPSPPKKIHFDDGTSNPRSARFIDDENSIRATVSGANSTVAATKKTATIHVSDDFNDFDEMEVSAMNFDKSKILANHLSEMLRQKCEDDEDNDDEEDGNKRKNNHHALPAEPKGEDGTSATLNLFQVSSGDSFLSEESDLTNVVSLLNGAAAATRNSGKSSKSASINHDEAESSISVGRGVVAKKNTPKKKSADPLSYLNDDDDDDDDADNSHALDNTAQFNSIEPLEGLFGSHKFAPKAPDDSIKELLDEADREVLDGPENFTTLLLRQEKEEKKKRTEKEKSKKNDEENANSALIQAAMRRLGNADALHRYQHGGKGLFDHEKKLEEKSVPSNPGQELESSVMVGRNNKSKSRDGSHERHEISKKISNVRSHTNNEIEASTRQFMQSLLDHSDDDDDDKKVIAASKPTNVVASVSNENNNHHHDHHHHHQQSSSSPQIITKTVIVRETTAEQLEEFENYARRLIKEAEFESFMIIRQCYQMMSFQLSMFSKKLARLQDATGNHKK